MKKVLKTKIAEGDLSQSTRQGRTRESLHKTGNVTNRVGGSTKIQKKNNAPFILIDSGFHTARNSKMQEKTVHPLIFKS